jgi:hypothetical protein
VPAVRQFLDCLGAALTGNGTDAPAAAASAAR